MEARPRSIKKYITENGRCPFDEWLSAFKDKRTQAVVTNRLLRIAQGNMGLCRSLGGSVQELKVDFGPGFASTLPRTVTRLWSSSVVETSRPSRRTSIRLGNIGRIIRRSESCQSVFATTKKIWLKN